MADRGIPSLTLLTWNIYGLQSSYLQERTRSICDYICTHQPSVVYLQEVVYATWPTITSALGIHYHCFCGNPKARYFIAILIRKDASIKCFEKEDVIEFPTSTMGRYLIDVHVIWHDLTIHFLTSHLESMDKERNVIERKKQMQTSFSLMQDYYEKNIISVFGGDLNTTDFEVQDVGLPDSIVDLWEVCGFDKKEKLTWNSNFPTTRYDRVYLCPKNGPVQPVKFYLIGREKLDEIDCHPSDHLGIWVEFNLRN